MTRQEKTAFPGLKRTFPGKLFVFDAEWSIIEPILIGTEGKPMKQSPEWSAAGQKLFKGAAVLGAAAVISKLLGTLQKIPLQNLGGDSVFGIYHAVYPLYILILTLATAGFPVAVAKFVAEETAHGRPDRALSVLRTSLFLSGAAGLLGFFALYAGADSIAWLIGNRQTAPAIRTASFALLFVPALASLRGYFQGLNNMMPTGVSQVMEQFVRVAAMLAILLMLVRAGASEAAIAAGATFGSAAGAFAGLLVMLFYWKAHVRKSPSGRLAAFSGAKPDESEHSGTAAVPRAKAGWKRLAAYALPVCLGSAAVPVLTLADTFTVPRILTAMGLNEPEAMSRFGLYNHGLPFVQLAAMIVSSVSVAIVPAVSSALAKGDWAGVRGCAEVSLRLAWLIGLGASAGIAVLAIPLNKMFFADAAGSLTVAVLGCAAVFSVVQIVTAAVLHGIGAERLPAWHLLAAAAFKVALNVLLVPVWGIAGAAAAAVAAYALAAALNAAVLVRRGVVRLTLRHYGLRPLFAAAVLAAAAGGTAFASEAAIAFMAPAVPERLRATAAALVAVAAGAGIYAAVLLRIGAITAAELAAVPKLGSRLAPLLIKWRLIPSEGGPSCPQSLPSSDSVPGTKIN